MVRRALLVANSVYDHPRIQDLPAPDRDATDLAALLSDPEVGDFEVELVRSGNMREVRMALQRAADATEGTAARRGDI